MSQPLIHRRKKLARALLYGLPLVLVAVTLLLIRYFEDLGFKDWSKEDWLDLEEVQIFQRYLQFDTSHPNGNEVAAAEFLAGILEKEGIAATVERIGDRHASLIATLEGTDKKALVLHHHIDVDEVITEGARFPPFAGIIDPPFIYGRGAFDMKGYGVAQLMAMLELKRSGKKLARSLTLLATGDEERDGLMGARFLMAEHPEWRQEFWGVLTEGGAIEALDVDRARYWGTEFAQKMLIEVKICDRSKERLEDLAEELRAVPRVRRVIPAIAPFLEIYGAYRDRPETRELLAHPDTLLARMKAFPRDVDVTVIPPYIDVMLTDEMQVSPIFPGDSGESGWQMFLVLWILPERTLDQAWGELIGERLRGFRYEVNQFYPKAVASPLDHPLFTGLDSFMKERFPDVPHGPLFIPWSASESRYFRLAGIPSYGFTPFWILSGDSNSMKGSNERLPLPAFVNGVALYQDLVARLVGVENKGFFD